MNEFDKEKLIEKDMIVVENRIRHAFNQGYEAGLKHGKKQEPCDTCEHSDEIDGNNCYECVKGMKNNYSSKKQESIDDVLDKIKAEVIARDRNVKTVRNDGRCLFTAVEVLLIIDKYREKSEE